MLEKHGVTLGCKGCQAIVDKRRGFPHTSACRSRFKEIVEEETDPHIIERKRRREEKENRIWEEVVEKEAKRNKLEMYQGEEKASDARGSSQVEEEEEIVRTSAVEEEVHEVPDTRKERKRRWLETEKELQQSKAKRVIHAVILGSSYGDDVNVVPNIETVNNEVRGIARGRPNLIIAAIKNQHWVNIGARNAR